MLVTHEREKLINAILYFAHNTRYLGKIKLFKLLFLLDYEHFRQTGCSVTGLEYRAWKFGPVPVQVMQEWDDPEPDLAAAISIQLVKVIDYVRETVVPRVPFDDSHSRYYRDLAGGHSGLRHNFADVSVVPCARLHRQCRRHSPAAGTLYSQRACRALLHLTAMAPAPSQNMKVLSTVVATASVGGGVVRASSPD